MSKHLFSLVRLSTTHKDTTPDKCRLLYAIKFWILSFMQICIFFYIFLFFACFMKISSILLFMRSKYIASINLILRHVLGDIKFCTFVPIFLYHSLCRDCVIYEMKDGFSTNVKLLIVHILSPNDRRPLSINENFIL